MTVEVNSYVCLRGLLESKRLKPAGVIHETFRAFCKKERQNTEGEANQSIVNINRWSGTEHSNRIIASVESAESISQPIFARRNLSDN